MFKKWLLFLKASWICKVVTKLIICLQSVITVCEYINKQLGNITLPANIISYLVIIQEFATSALVVLKKLSLFVCREDITTKIHITCVEDAAEHLKQISKELHTI